MIKKSVGRFAIGVDASKYPIECLITDTVGQISVLVDHRDLSDLAYAVEQMKKMARERLANIHKGEV